MEPFVFLAVPAYDSIEPRALDGLSCAASKARWYRKVECTSLLPHTFNLLWCVCLNNRHLGFTHFAMHHADIQASPDWLDALLEEMDRVDADVLSVIVPIKDRRGLTSAGLRDGDGNIRRFTMRELAKMPETFSIGSVDLSKQLMVNTGLWICRLGDWVDEFPGFSIVSAICTEPDGSKRAKVLSEDWNASVWLANRGLRVFLTRKIQVNHYGKAVFSNHGEWGDCETDPGDNPSA